MGGARGEFQLVERSGEVGAVSNPVGSWIWEPFLERTGGLAPDLPGSGRRAKPGFYDYSLSGYADFLERFAEARGLERFSLVIHDIGADRRPSVRSTRRRATRSHRRRQPRALLPDYPWHRFARIWRAPVLGEVFMATMTPPFFRRSLRRSNVRACPTTSSIGRGKTSIVRSAYAEALRGDVELEVYDHAGHWLWLDRPEVPARVVAFLAGER